MVLNLNLEIEKTREISDGLMASVGLRARWSGSLSSSLNPRSLPLSLVGDGNCCMRNISKKMNGEGYRALVGRPVPSEYS